MVASLHCLASAAWHTTQNLVASNNGILLLLMSLWLAGCCCWSGLGLAAPGCACSCICGQLAGQLGAGWSRLASLICPQNDLQFSEVMRAPNSHVSHHPAGVTKEGKHQCASTFHISYFSHLLLYHWPQSKSHGQAQSVWEGTDCPGTWVPGSH